MRSFIEETMPRQIADLARLVRIPSVSRGEPEPGMPFGRPVHDALETALDMARDLGFSQARSLDGCCGVIDFGQGEEMLMIMAHLDVVPAGTGWTCDPFGAEIKNGRIYGRGVLDDKGAAVSALYALAAVRNAGVPLRRRVRILLGCDEEAGWRCIERYKETEPEPTLAFTPDAEYPLVHSEMAITHATYERKLPGTKVCVRCGTAANVIPGEAVAVLPFTPLPCAAPAGFSVVYEGDTVRVIGRGGHASQPEDAKNALLALLDMLARQPLDTDDLAAATALHALLASDMHGEGFGLDIADASGRLTLAPTMLSWDAAGVSLTLDCRHPFACPFERLRAALDAAFGAVGFAAASVSSKEGHFIAPDSELVRTLLDVYRRHTGRTAKPLSIGGGTYARAFENAVGFGLVREGEEALFHVPDESMSLDDIRFNTLVIADAIAALAGACASPRP